MHVATINVKASGTNGHVSGCMYAYIYIYIYVSYHAHTIYILIN